MWHYQARRRTQRCNGEHYYEVIAVYKNGGRSRDNVNPCGETKAELIAELGRMLSDIKRYRTIIEKEETP